MSLPESGWVAIALLGKARGNRGEITALPLSDKPDRYQALHEVYLEGGGAEPHPYTVEEAWFHQGVLIFKFRGVDTIADAERLSGAEVRVPGSRARGAGCRASSSNRTWSAAKSWNVPPAAARTRHRMAGRRRRRPAGGRFPWLIPFARSICVEIDPAARRIAVELPPGLKDLNRP